MDTTIVNTTQPPMPPQPPVATPTTLENGGASSGVSSSSSNSLKDFYKSTNWVEIGFMVLGVATYLFLIKYYRQRMYVERETMRKLQLQLDETRAEIAKMKTPPKKKQSRSF